MVTYHSFYYLWQIETLVRITMRARCNRFVRLNTRRFWYKATSHPAILDHFSLRSRQEIHELIIRHFLNDSYPPSLPVLSNDSHARYDDCRWIPQEPGLPLGGDGATL